MMSTLLFLTNRKLLLKAIVSTILLAPFILCATTYAATTDTIHNASPVVTNQTEEVLQIRALAASALAQVAHIRAQVRNNKYDHVRDNLVQLYTLIELIKAARPTGEVDALIVFYREHLAFEDNKQILADILPLYRALDTLPNSQQKQKARKQLNDVRNALQEGKRSDALKALEAMQLTLAIDGVDFPLQAAEEKLQNIANLYDEQHRLSKVPELLGLETDLLQIIHAI